MWTAAWQCEAYMHIISQQFLTWEVLLQMDSVLLGMS